MSQPRKKSCVPFVRFVPIVANSGDVGMSIREDLTVPYQHAGSLARFLAQSDNLYDRLTAPLEQLAHDLLYAAYKDEDIDAEPWFSNMIMQWNAYRNTLPDNHRAMLAPSLIDDKIYDLRRLVYYQQYAAEAEEINDQKWAGLGDLSQDDSIRGAKKLLEMQQKCGNTDRTLNVLNQAGERPRINAARDSGEVVFESRKIVREELLPLVTYYRRRYMYDRDEGDKEQVANAQMHMILSDVLQDLVYGVLDYEEACAYVRREWQEHVKTCTTLGLIDENMLEQGLGELDAAVNAHQHSVEREERWERSVRGIPEPNPVERRLPEVRTKSSIQRPGGLLASQERQVEKPSRAGGNRR
jgi:hypothetical protein